MNMDETARIVALAREFYPKWEPTPVTTESWNLLLGKFPYQQVKEALLQVVRTEQNFGRPDPGAVARLCEGPNQGVDEVIAICDDWYRMNDDVSRRPNRDDREKHPLAYKTWQIAGGFDALHDSEWAHKRLRDAFKEAVTIQQDQENFAAVSGSEGFMAELGRRMNALPAGESDYRRESA